MCFPGEAMFAFKQIEGQLADCWKNCPNMTLRSCTGRAQNTKMLIPSAALETSLKSVTVIQKVVS